MNIEYMEPNILEKRLRSLVRLDEAMTPPEKDWLRIWTSGISDDGVRWYMLDNGGGDSMIILFAQAGVLVKGFDHENALNQFASDGEWDDAFFEYVFRDMPRELAPLLTDDERNETTFCMWYQYDTGKWYQNEYPDNDGGKKYLLGYIPQTAEELYVWAKDYYDEEGKKGLSLETVEQVFNAGSDRMED